MEKRTPGNWSFPSFIHLLGRFAQTCFSSDLGTHSNRNPDKYLLTPPPQWTAGPLPAGQLQSVTTVTPSFLPEDGQGAGALARERAWGEGRRDPGPREAGMEGAGKGSPNPSLSSQLCPSPMDGLAAMALQASCSQRG